MTLRSRISQIPRLTLFGRAVLLIGAELVFNAVCWVAAGIVFREGDGLLGLALLAWTIGLRHGLDADHISAIDNATRQLVSLGQLPITCGLFFSLGHSTIVIAVNIALAISVDIYDKLDGVGAVGGIIGTSVSASFLFLIATLNIYFLVGALKTRKEMKRRQRLGLPLDTSIPAIQGGGCLVRIIGPLLKAVNKSWKMYPVGILFGFGFDTASSIALLAISAIAQKGPSGEGISHGKIIILPFLFTAGMSLVDSLDSVLMLYAYASPSTSSSEGKLSIFYDRKPQDPLLSDESTLPHVEMTPLNQRVVDERDVEFGEAGKDEDANKLGQAELNGMGGTAEEVEPNRVGREIVETKTNVMSNLSITLTVLSIIVALSISIIEILGLIGENCTSCVGAAESTDPDQGGLAGSWWRFWADVNDNSGYVGAGIVGCFAVVVGGYWGGKWAVGRWGRRL